MKIQKIVTAAVMVTALLLAGCGDRRPPAPPDMFKALKLTTAQEEQLQVYREKQDALMRTEMKRVRKLHEDLDDEFLKTTPDEKVIASKITEIKFGQEKAISQHFQGLLMMREVLTPEQFKQMVRMNKEHRVHMDKMFRHGPFSKRFGKHMKGGELPPPPPPGMEER